MVVIPPFFDFLYFFAREIAKKHRKQCLNTGGRSGLPCPVACGRLAGAGLGSHCGVEFGRSRTG
jgi:hypothetical protein